MSLVLEQQELMYEDDGELHEKLVEKQLSDEQLNELLLEKWLDEVLELQQLLEISLQHEVVILLELQGWMFEEDEQLQDELLDLELFDGEADERLHDFWLDEINAQLILVEIQLKLELKRLQEQQWLCSEDDWELQKDQFEGELDDGQLEDLLLHISLEEVLE